MNSSAPRPPNARTLTEREFFYGHKACAGCGGSMAVRLALKVLGERTFTVVPAGCMSAVGFIFPQLSFTGNAIISTFAGTASMLSGVAAATRALGIKNSHAVGFAGDGATADIGIQALSGAIDRHDKIIYICYDNEAYMNTGVQKSGLTPFGARTTTTPATKDWPGSTSRKKDMFEIVAAHGIDYAATASVGYVQDFLAKIHKAKSVEGTSYLHVFAPCPTGRGCESEITVEIAKEAVDCGLWYLAEYENQEFRLNRNPTQFSSIRSYLDKQARFRHLEEGEIANIIQNRDKAWERIRSKWVKTQPAPRT